jgi:tRNA dimethylallyltransferase
MDSRKIAVIMGPTASGKSSLALKLAKDFSGEIISFDSMQVYRGLEIGVAKPTREEQEAIPHHLIDILDISKPLDVYKYIELAEKKIDEISKRGKLPIIAGGTGFYIRALLYGLDPLPGDASLRAELDEKYDNDEGFEDLKKLMSEKDPADYERWHMHRRKLIRALEVFELTGKSITELQTINKPKLRYPVISWNLTWDRAVLRERIEKRTEEMLNAGWVEEAETAIKNGLLESPTAHQALGYKTIAEYLDGKMDFDAMKDKIAVATWQFARRQITWFKSKHPESEKIQMPVAYDELRAKFKNSEEL